MSLFNIEIQFLLRHSIWLGSTSRLAGLWHNTSIRLNRIHRLRIQANTIHFSVWCVPIVLNTSYKVWGGWYVVPCVARPQTLAFGLIYLASLFLIAFSSDCCALFSLQHRLRLNPGWRDYFVSFFLFFFCKKNVMMRCVVAGLALQVGLLFIGATF